MCLLPKFGKLPLGVDQCLAQPLLACSLPQSSKAQALELGDLQAHTNSMGCGGAYDPMRDVCQPPCCSPLFHVCAQPNTLHV